MAKTKRFFTNLNPFVRGILLFLGGLLILLIILQIIVSLFADDYAANYVKDKVRSSSDSTYTLGFDDLDLNVFAGSVTISNLKINADISAFSDTLSPSKRPPGMLFTGTIGEVNVSGVNVFSAIWGNELHASSITITKPTISALRNPRKIPADSSKHFSSVDSSLYAAFSKRYKALEIGEFSIEGGKGLMIQSGDTLTSLAELNLSLQDIRVDSASAQSGRTFITHDISLNTGPFEMKMADSLNTLKLNKLAISSDDQTISLDSLQLIPRYPRFKFGAKNGYEIDRIDLTVPEVHVQQVDFSRFIDSARFYAGYAEINNANFNDFRNKNLPFPPNHHPPLPHSAFQNLAQKIKIDSMKVNNAFIAYNEYWYEAPQAGRLTFENLNATLYNITNYPEDVKKGTSIVMDARTNVMGEGLLEAHFEFPMDTKNGFHKVSGKLHKMNMESFNPMLQYVAFARVDRGILNSLEFDMTLNNTRSNGTLVMNYEDFKISVLDKKSIKQKGILENVKTFVANNFVVKENNTPEDGMRPGPISFERIQRKAVFNYWWKSLLSGIKKSLGA